MSQEDIERARAGLEAFNRRDIDALLELLHPDIELMPSLVGGVEQTVFRGRAGYRQWFDATWETYDHVWLEPHSFRSVGDQVVVIYTTHVRAKQSGRLAINARTKLWRPSGCGSSAARLKPSGRIDRGCRV
jgi:ketosteroid isomerase-like protein